MASKKLNPEQLWELRPIDKRPDCPGVTEHSHASASHALSMCFSSPFLHGCSFCAVGDEETVHVRHCSDRVHSNFFIPDSNSTLALCSAIQRPSCDVQTVLEDAEDIDNDSSHTESAADDREFGERGSCIGSAQDANPELQHELRVLKKSIADIAPKQDLEMVHIGGDHYNLNGRKIKLLLLPSVVAANVGHLQALFGHETALRAARVIVCDGSLSQPLLDYFLHTGQNECYDTRGTENIADISGAARHLDFNIAPTEDRILEMRCATIQADMRRKADGSDTSRMSSLECEGMRLLGKMSPGDVSFQMV